MGLFYPCCCCSVQTGTKIIATVNAVWAILEIVTGIITIIQVKSVSNVVHAYLDQQMQRVFYEDDQYDFYLKQYRKKSGRDIDPVIVSILVIVIACVTMLCGIFLLVISLLLYTGAQKENVVMCKIWLIVYGSCTFLGGLGLAILVTRNPTGKKCVSLIVGLMINCYFMWVVIVFIKKLRKKTISRLNGSSYAMDNTTE